MKNQTRIFSGSVVLGLLLAAGSVLQAAPSPKEQELLAILKSDAPKAEKAITCKKLAIFGGKDAVPSLAPFLADPEMASWARIGLEAIPDPSVDDVFREALGKLQGKLLVGVINSIGRRKDAKAVNALTQKLKDTDVEVAGSAAIALGKIGGDTAAKALEQALPAGPLPVRGDVAEGCILVAEQFLAEGKANEAIRLYDLVRKAEVPQQRLLEATRGAILARKTAGLPLLLEQLRSAEKAFFHVGLSTARELPGKEITEALAAEAERAPLDRQTLLMLVLADRPDGAALPTIRKAAKTGSKPLRLAAVSALDRLASVEDVPLLLDIAGETDADLSKAARTAISRMPGKDADRQIVARLPQAAGKAGQTLIELAAQRQVLEAVPAIMKHAASPEPEIRGAALAAVGSLGDEKQVGDLVAMLPKAQDSRHRGDLEKALMSIGSRRGAQSLNQVAPLAKSADPALRMVGLHVLSSIGGSAALAAVKAALEDQDPAVQDEAVRTLSNWPSSWPDEAGVGEPLLTLAKTGKKTLHQVLGVRGYLQYLPGDKKLSDAQKVAQVKELLPLVKRPEEKRLAVTALGAVPNGPALELLAGFAADDAVAEEACLAIVNTAGRGDLKDAAKEVRQKALQTVVEKTRVDKTKRKAQDLLRKLK